MPNFSNSDIPAIKHLESKLTPFFEAIEKQLQQVTAAADHLSQEISKYFELNQEKLVLLAEVPSNGEAQFICDELKPGIEQVLKLQSSDLMNTDALRLPFLVNINQDKRRIEYQYDKSKNLTPYAVEYFTQLSQMLSIFVAVSMLIEAYEQVLSASFVNIGKCVNLFQLSLEQQLIIDGKQFESLLNSFNENKELKQGIKSQRHFIGSSKEDFRLFIAGKQSDIGNIYGFIEETMQNAYAQHQNQSKLWMMFDSAWQSLLKGLSTAIYEHNWGYSTNSGTLSINKEYLPNKLKEIMEFQEKSLQSIPLLRTELLNAASLQVSDNKGKLRTIATSQKINIDRAYSGQFFTKPPQNPNDNIYAVMLEALKSEKKDIIGASI